MRADNVFEVDVAPLVGAWIEIAAYVLAGVSREVAPLVGAWIEIFGFTTLTLGLPSRSPCGSVD